MRLKRRHKKLITDALTLVILVLSTFALYYGLQFVLATGTPLVAVVGGSMRPTLDMGDLVIVQGVPATDIHQGDIIVFEPPQGSRGYTVHRVVKTQSLANGTILFTTKGDDNDAEDRWPVPDNLVHGRVIYHIPYLGYLALDPTIPIIIVFTVVMVILLWPEKKRTRHRF